MAKRAYLLCIAILALVILSIFIFLTCNVAEEKGYLLSELSSAEKIMWIGPHPDDEVYVAGLLALASLEMGKNCVIVSFTCIESRKAYNLNSSEILHARYVYLENYEGKTWREKLIKLLSIEHPDIVITFEPTNGFRSSEGHAKVAQLVTDVLREKFNEIKLYYVINRDPVLAKLLGGNMDPLPYTDVLDLDTYSEKLGCTYWNIKLKVVQVYSDVMSAYRYIAENKNNIQEKIMHKEFYRKVSLTS